METNVIRCCMYIDVEYFPVSDVIWKWPSRCSGFCVVYTWIDNVNWTHVFDKKITAKYLTEAMVLTT